MKYNDLYLYAKEHNVSEQLCSYLIDNYLNIPNIDKINNQVMTDKNKEKFINAIDRLKTEPIQYIVGNVNFYGYIYKVTKDTLIPRFETEQLVEETIKYIKEKYDTPIEIVDIGCGTGCIGITLKRELPNVNVTLTDISKEALDVAKENKKELDIKIIQGDMLKPLIGNKYDVLISNPPYLSHDDCVMSIVKNNEPKQALYADNDGLYYYEEILKNANTILNDNFIIALEIGNQQKNKIIELANKYLKNIKIITKKDLQQKDRMIFIFND